MFLLGSNPVSAADSADVDSDDVETKSISSQYTLDPDHEILDTFAPLARFEARADADRVLSGGSLLMKRGAGALSLYREEDDAEESPEEEDAYSERSFGFGGYDSGLSWEEDSPLGRFALDQGFIHDESDDQTEVPFTRNHSWEHVLGYATTSDVSAPPLFVRSRLDNLIDEAVSNRDDDSGSDAPLDLDSLPSDIHIVQIPTHSEAARIAVLLNSRELRRDPWNMSLPTEIVQYDGATDTAQVSPTTATKGHFGADRDGATATSDWTFLMQRTCGPSSENAYYRPWNDPPLATIRDCFNLAQQLLEGLVFFHEQGLSRVPFAANNLVMDIGLAPYPESESSHPADESEYTDTPPGADINASADQSIDTSESSLGITRPALDRATYPVKYYLASLDGLCLTNAETVQEGLRSSVTAPGSEDCDSAADRDDHVHDIVNLGALIKELFSSVPGDPLAPLYEFMLSSAGASSTGGLSAPPNDRASSSLGSASGTKGPSGPASTYAMRPTASSSLDLLQYIEAKHKKSPGSLNQPLETIESSRATPVPAVVDTYVAEESDGIGVDAKA